jgi:hypothetical protein
MLFLYSIIHYLPWVQHKYYIWLIKIKLSFQQKNICNNKQLLFLSLKKIKSEIKLFES